MDLPQGAEFLVAAYKGRSPAGMQECARLAAPADGFAHALQI
jgi:hypothetical protein